MLSQMAGFSSFLWLNNIPLCTYTTSSLSIHLCCAVLSLSLCNPMDSSLPGSSVHGILQARILEWVAVPFSRGSSCPRDWTCSSYVSCIGRRVLYHCCHLGSPLGSDVFLLSLAHMAAENIWRFSNFAFRSKPRPFPGRMASDLTMESTILSQSLSP